MSLMVSNNFFANVDKLDIQMNSKLPFTALVPSRQQEVPIRQPQRTRGKKKTGALNIFEAAALTIPYFHFQFTKEDRTFQLYPHLCNWISFEKNTLMSKSFAIPDSILYFHIGLKITCLRQKVKIMRYNIPPSTLRLNILTQFSSIFKLSSFW